MMEQPDHLLGARMQTFTTTNRNRCFESSTNEQRTASTAIPNDLVIVPARVVRRIESSRILKTADDRNRYRWTSNDLGESYVPSYKFAIEPRCMQLNKNTSNTVQ